MEEELNGLSFENIVDVENFFTSPIEQLESQENKEEVVDKTENVKKETNNGEDELNTEEENDFVNENLFLKGMRSKEEDKKEDANPPEGQHFSKKNVYSSIAKAFKEDDIFDFSDEELENIKNSDDFSELINKYINKRLTEQQLRVVNLLDNDVEPSQIKNYENILGFLRTVTEEQLDDDNSADLRNRLILQDLLNKGYTKDEALEELNDVLENGTDIKRAKKALVNNIQFTLKCYDQLIENTKRAVEESKKKYIEDSEKLKDSIMNEKNLFGDLVLDKTTRQKIYDNINTPKYKVEGTNQRITEIQKYASEHPNEFRKYISVFYTLTDGFKNMDNLVKGKVRKEINKGIRHLEDVLQNNGSMDGNITFVGGGDTSLFDNFLPDDR